MNNILPCYAEISSWDELRISNNFMFIIKKYIFTSNGIIYGKGKNEGKNYEGIFFEGSFLKEKL
jgi:hypothetical protein